MPNSNRPYKQNNAFFSGKKAIDTDTIQEVGDRIVLPNGSIEYKDTSVYSRPQSTHQGFPIGKTYPDQPDEVVPQPVQPEPEVPVSNQEKLEVGMPPVEPIVPPINSFEDISNFDLLSAFNQKADDLITKLTLPAGVHKLISDFVAEYTKIHKNDTEVARSLNLDEVTMINNVQGTDTFGVREGTLLNNKGENYIQHEGKNILGKKVSMSVENTKVSGQVAVSLFNSLVNQTSIFSHNLPSSGFSVSLVDIPEVEVAKLAKILNRSTIRKSRDTRGNLHSNYGMLVMKELLDFISGYIYSTSIDVDNYKLGNYIRVTDMPVLILLLMEYLHQDGFEIITSCANTMVHSEDGKPKCSSTIAAKIDLSKLLVVDPDKLNTAARKHLAITSSNAHSVKEVVDYQNTLPSNDNKTITITSGSSPFKIELRNPTMTEAIEAMDQWEHVVRDGVSDVTMGKSDEEIAELLNAHSLKTVLGMYLHFIASISDNNGNYVVDRDTILDVLISFNSNREVVADIVRAVKEYIGETTIGFIGYTPYVCSTCGHNNGGSEIIGLDMISLGFGLVDLATLKMSRSPHTF